MRALHTVKFCHKHHLCVVISSKEIERVCEWQSLLFPLSTKHGEWYGKRNISNQFLQIIFLAGRCLNGRMAIANQWLERPRTVFGNVPKWIDERCLFYGRLMPNENSRSQVCDHKPVQSSLRCSTDHWPTKERLKFPTSNPTLSTRCSSL